MQGFTVIDNKTGHYPDCWEIALNEEWAKHLCYCDMDGFAITEDGTLVLLDECGGVAYCPADRFTVVTVKVKKEKPPTDLAGKCGSCVYASTDDKEHFTTMPSYIRCMRPEKMWIRELAAYKQRTTRCCAAYKPKGD